MASNPPGAFFGKADQARTIAKAIRKGEKPERPEGRNVPFAEYEEEYASAVGLVALRRIEELLEVKTLKPKDAAILLEAVREHAEQIRKRPKPERPGKGTGHLTLDQKEEKRLRQPSAPPRADFAKLDGFERPEAAAP